MRRDVLQSRHTVALGTVSTDDCDVSSARSVKDRSRVHQI